MILSNFSLDLDIILIYYHKLNKSVEGDLTLSCDMKKRK